MANGYSAVSGIGVPVKQYTDGAANNIAPADHNGMFTGSGYLVMFQHEQNAEGCHPDFDGSPLDWGLLR